MASVKDVKAAIGENYFFAGPAAPCCDPLEGWAGFDLTTGGGQDSPPLPKGRGGP